MLKISDCYISYLNLDSRPDRRAQTEDEFKRAGITAVRTRGKLPNEFDLSDSKLQVMKNRTPGAIPCHYGQVEIMKEALRQNKSCIVFEDDIQMCSDIQERFKYIEKWTETHKFDVIWLNGTFHLPAFWHTGKNPDLRGAYLNRDAELTDDPRMIRTFGCFSTHAWIINKDSIQKILDLLEENVHLSMGIDWIMIRIQPQLLCYSFVPGCIRQYDNQSNIGNGITYYSSFASLGPHWYADKMENFNPITYDWKDAKI